MTVTREDRVVTIGEERGLRGRNGLIQPQPLVMCAISGTANALIFSPSDGYAAAGDGGAQLFGGTAAFDNTGSVIAVIAGLNDGDPRNVFLPGGAAVSAGTIHAGEFVAVKFVTSTGLFELVHPAPRDVAQASSNAEFYASANSRIYAHAAFGK